MDITPQIFNARVMHKRLFPKVNQFSYGIYYLALPLAKLQKKSHIQGLAFNHFSPISFYEKDHGALDGSSNKEWVDAILSDYGLDDTIKDIMLVCMPRVLGYVFNPVSFWFCFDEEQNLRAVLCEVHNTFGENHSYLCAHEDHHPIDTNDWLKAEKIFHVSPFLRREGSYQFRFSLQDNKLGVWIDFYDDDGNKQLLTSLVGTLEALTRKSLRRVFWRHPLVTLKAIILIHWQAVRLVFKGIKYISKPVQRDEKISATKNLNKM